MAYAGCGFNEIELKQDHVFCITYMRRIRTYFVSEYYLVLRTSYFCLSVQLLVLLLYYMIECTNWDVSICL